MHAVEEIPETVNTKSRAGRSRVHCGIGTREPRGMINMPPMTCYSCGRRMWPDL